ncbi:uncharacterized protein LOC116849062 isoform X1 [Odontomachus brunneus]|uniref:uncharacterized protein LOC116849062 isoform X1 n=1 Tax=Odontomachus brunneus TaxID=486640 RepID=UPI0013F246B2|nr:uncharacterized protein LOC116849062 isoform X1 [Odontomachus brunneus]XP_032681733.1 uncharacterized protein LOC116849062 isoform X1 [Odontomachus brunneus]
MAIVTDHLEPLTYHSWLPHRINYNDFFHPNICHFCKKTNNDDLILCNNCYMISYCSDEHLLTDQPLHEVFCSYLKTYTLIKYGHKWRSFRFSEPQWIQSRYEFLCEITKQFIDLTLHEINIIIFAKSCYLCHQQEFLYYCHTCYSENYCAEHVHNFSNHHSSKCEALKLYLNLNIKNIYFNMYQFIRICTEFPDDEKRVENMENFVMGYAQNSHHTNIREWIYSEYIYSDYASRSLTLYDGIKKAGLLDTLDVEECVLHIISGGFVQKKYVYAWEILLHLLHRIKNLKVVLIGKRLEVGRFNVLPCMNCIKRSLMFTFEIYSLFYDEFMLSPAFHPPNIIIAFQADFKALPWTWKNTLLVSQRIKCPYFLTAASQTIAEANIQIIQESINVEPKYNAPNNFKSYVPCRLLSSDYIGYPNSHVIIYESLNSQRSETDTSSPSTS